MAASSALRDEVQTKPTMTIDWRGAWRAASSRERSLMTPLPAATGDRSQSRRLTGAPVMVQVETKLSRVPKVALPEEHPSNSGDVGLVSKINSALQPNALTNGKTLVLQQRKLAGQEDAEPKGSHNRNNASEDNESSSSKPDQKQLRPLTADGATSSQSAHALPTDSIRLLCLQLSLFASAAFVAIITLRSWVTRAPHRGSLSAAMIYDEVRKLPTMRGRSIIRMFGMRDDKHGLTNQAVRTGCLIRIKGTICVDDHADSALTAPLSERVSVHYSASVSRSRHDGIHSPPLSFQTAGRNFSVRLADDPSVQVSVRCHDVALFSMDTGLTISEHPFVEAPDSWRSFVISHLAPSPDASAHFESCKDLSADGGLLEFRESALFVGSMVSCVGEVAREQNGELCLYPWRPELTLAASRQSKLAWLRNVLPWMAASKERPVSTAFHAMIGRVMVSDDGSL